MSRKPARLYDYYWLPVQDGDDRARAIFDRHYSRIHYADGRKPSIFVGPGEKMVLLSQACDALFVWRKFKDDSGQQGVNCAVFRNEGKILSSLLIAEAETCAWRRWPGQRLYTYVGTEAVRPKTNPGQCFIKAGWQPCGETKVNKLLILERWPAVLAPALPVAPASVVTATHAQGVLL